MSVRSFSAEAHIKWLQNKIDPALPVLPMQSSGFMLFLSCLFFGKGKQQLLTDLKTNMKWTRAGKASIRQTERELGVMCPPQLRFSPALLATKAEMDFDSGAN